MLSTLLKKQFLEFNSGYFMDRKTGKMRSKGKTAAYILLFVMIFVLVGFAIFMLAMSLCKPFSALKLDWFYFTVMGLMALVLSVFGSVFNTYNALYLAKDNELLLSMPIKPGDIMLSRMAGVYGLALMFEAIVYIPTLIAWFIYGNVTVLSGIYSVLLMLFLAVISLVLSCALGFLVALIASKTKNNSIITVIMSLLFFAGYFYFYSNITNVLGKIAQNGMALAEKFESYAYICCVFGKAAAGNSLYMLLFAAITAVLFALTYFILTKSFIKIVTFKKGGGTSQAVSYEKQNVKKPESRSSALLKREFKRFLSSPIYILNCGIGIVFMFVASAVLVYKSSDIKKLLVIIKAIGFKPGAVSVLCTVIIWMFASTCYFTAPSISLEGNRLWILKTLPVDPKEIFAAKQKMHLVLAGIPTVITSVVVAAVFHMDLYLAVLMTVTNVAFVQFMSAGGLALNLLMPNLSWTNEAIPVKQSAPVMISLFGGCIIAVAAGVGYYFLRKKIEAEVYIVILLVVTVFVTRFINKFINTKGTELFKEM